MSFFNFGVEISLIGSLIAESDFSSDVKARETLHGVLYAGINAPVNGAAERLLTYRGKRRGGRPYL